jgi:hypothetical protein
MHFFMLLQLNKQKLNAFRVDRLMEEHLVYQKIGTLWLSFIWY